ncbi:formylglycine-generating enzyme family protein [Streptomyces sp. NPDC127039]|uniref:formylglycine-generating enzyme family protein n=1 Tax=Streptomyces sp. NPDC127039 TaxID=3347115 RepID=UPI0036463B1B
MSEPQQDICCTPAPQRDTTATAVTPDLSLTGPPRPGSHTIGQSPVPAGMFTMGDAQGDGRPADGERPVHAVTLDAFSLDVTTVTVADFRRFAEATGYRTEAERCGSSAVFHTVVAAEPSDILGAGARTPWWLGVRGADWRHPEGPRSDTAGREDHPAVHITWNDAQAYCAWARRRLPTEAEWERAARGGVECARYPWGDDAPDRDGTWRCNIWQGSFPDVNTGEDGWITTAPARSYTPNSFGLWQTVGNVWEWCQDIWSPRAYADRAYAAVPVHDPRGPAAGSRRVLRGGSYLCHGSYCDRYRNSARSANTPDSSMGNAGFRTAAL